MAQRTRREPKRPKGWPEKDGRPATVEEIRAFVAEVEAHFMGPIEPTHPHFCRGCSAPLEHEPCAVCWTHRYREHVDTLKALLRENDARKPEGLQVVRNPAVGQEAEEAGDHAVRGSAVASRKPRRRHKPNALGDGGGAGAGGSKPPSQEEVDARLLETMRMIDATADLIDTGIIIVSTLPIGGDT